MHHNERVSGRARGRSEPWLLRNMILVLGLPCIVIPAVASLVLPVASGWFLLIGVCLGIYFIAGIAAILVAGLREDGSRPRSRRVR